MVGIPMDNAVPRRDEPVREQSADAVATAAAAVAISPARWTELRAVARLQQRAFRPRLAYGFTTLMVLKLLPQVRFVVARLGDQVVGCGIGDRQDGHSRVINLAVDPGFRRRGIAAALLAALEAALPDGNLVLMVEAENTAAQALYERAGYTRVGAANDYYGPGRHGVWMQKRRTSLATPKFWV